MKMILGAALVVAMTAAAAIAQTAPSTSDGPAPSGSQKTTDPKQSSPGATGAMSNEASPLATSPQDVKQQQEGKGTAAMPKARDDNAPGASSAPGAVGAAPGSDASQGKSR
ncbi:hypothetical protein [Chenggangzhangella methanolivorans]|uniref:Proteophosphoglycan ppg4 n=1 Tax=Chenggangzhangella methanolivorans TaxID=1437009 RepID=A0A9E6UMD1_9HYPH|nr:hypothetical protein [Chenggangzhangella methanolivorans]QZN99073.1 hypothetical protein K6K41_19780 [Chenggangzhangella methanolivorans]